MTFNPQPKNKRVKDPEYIEWVESLNCVGNDGPGGDAHHITGYGLSGMATKPDDYFTIPLCREEHTKLHQGPKRWEQYRKSQMAYCIATLITAHKQGIITTDIFEEYRLKCFKAWGVIK